MSLDELWVVRHGETEWSLSGQHTGVTDLPLTDNGEAVARRLRDVLGCREFAAVFTSPRQRARRTCELAGYGDQAQVLDDLQEWNYGRYEGRTTKEIREERPGWDIWTQGNPGGEGPGQVARRADAVIAAAEAIDGPVLAFAHGHILRVVAARWVEETTEMGRHLALDAAGLGVLGYERDTRVLRRWNYTDGGL